MSYKERNTTFTSTGGQALVRASSSRSAAARRILLRPLFGRQIVFFRILQQQLRYLRHEWVVRIGVSEQRRNRQQHLRNCQGGTPLVLENVKANGTAAVHVAVIYFRRELYLRRLEGVIGREGHVKEENPTRVR